MMAKGHLAERELEIVSPRLTQLREALHQQWENALPGSEDVERECKHLIRAVRMLERLFQKDIDGAAIARSKMTEES